MKFLDVLEEVLKSDERFVGENSQVIKTKVSDAARGFHVIIMTRADSQVSTRVLQLQPKFKIKNINRWCAI